MTRNKSYLSDYEEIDGGFVAFGRDPKGGKITGKSKISDTGFKLEFGRCDTECVVLSPGFKLLDENHVLFRVPRKDNMYSVDLKNIVPSKGLHNQIRVQKGKLGIIEAVRPMLADIQIAKPLSGLKQLILLVMSKTRKNSSKAAVSVNTARPNNTAYLRPIVNSARTVSNIFNRAHSHVRRPFNKFTTNKNSNLNEKVNTVRRNVTTLGSKVVGNPQLELQDESVNSANNINTVSLTVNADSIEDNDVDENIVYGCVNDPNMPNLEEIVYSDDDEDVDAEADMTNLDTHILVSPTLTTRIYKDHPLEQIIGDIYSAPQTRKMTKSVTDHVEPKKVIQALTDPSWIEAMQDELLQFKLQKVWTLVDLPYGKRAIGTKWIYRNKKDERGIVVRNKARLVAQGYTQEEGIDYDEVFALVARIEAIRLFLAYASFKDFVVYQMDVKSAFLYGKIEEEVYVCQPPGFEDPEFPDRVYKVEKALYGLHQAPRAWYETLSTYLLDNGFQRGTIDKTLFIKKVKGDILLVQVYVDDIIFGSTKKGLCTDFEKMMHKKFQMSSMGELTFFLGLQVTQKDDGIFISQDKYVDEILKKFGFSTLKQQVHPWKLQSHCSSMQKLKIFQVTPKASHLHAVKGIFRYLKGQPKLGLWPYSEFEGVTNWHQSLDLHFRLHRPEPGKSFWGADYEGISERRKKERTEGRGKSGGGGRGGDEEKRREKKKGREREGEGKRLQTRRQARRPANREDGNNGEQAGGGRPGRRRAAPPRKAASRQNGASPGGGSHPALRAPWAGRRPAHGCGGARGGAGPPGDAGGAWAAAGRPVSEWSVGFPPGCPACGPPPGACVAGGVRIGVGGPEGALRTPNEFLLRHSITTIDSPTRNDGDDDDATHLGMTPEHEDEDQEDEEVRRGGCPLAPPTLLPAYCDDKITVRPQTSISLPPETEVERLLAMTTPSPSPPISLSPPSAEERLASSIHPALIDAVRPHVPPPPLPPSLYIPQPVDCRDDIPESEQPPPQEHVDAEERRQGLDMLGTR
ncbi:putative ribonuclease H-like domain-containing protein [Tanacetum coccineum]